MGSVREVGGLLGIHPRAVRHPPDPCPMRNRRPRSGGPTSPTAVSTESAKSGTIAPETGVCSGAGLYDDPAQNKTSSCCRTPTNPELITLGTPILLARQWLLSAVVVSFLVSFTPVQRGSDDA